MLKCKQLKYSVILPTVSHPGEDLGFDLYSCENIELPAGKVSIVSTGIAATFVADNIETNRFGEPITMIPKYGLLYRDRSSMAAKGITVSGGVIDASYTGELKVLLTNNSGTAYPIEAGDKIAQMIPTKVRTYTEIIWVDELDNSGRGEKGFGSSGK